MKDVPQLWYKCGKVPLNIKASNIAGSIARANVTQGACGALDERWVTRYVHPKLKSRDYDCKDKQHPVNPTKGLTLVKVPQVSGKVPISWL